MKPLFLYLMVLIGIDDAFIILSTNDYSIFLFHYSGWTIPFFFNIVSLLVLLVIFKKKVLWIPVVVLVICLFLNRMGSLFIGWNYDYAVSPKGTETLIIKHRKATLGESHYFYEFYHKTFLGLLLKKLPEQDLHIVVRDLGRRPNAQEALGLDHPDWLSERKSAFSQKTAERRFG